MISSFFATGIMNDFDEIKNDEYTFPTHISAYIDNDLVSETNHNNNINITIELNTLIKGIDNVDLCTQGLRESEYKITKKKKLILT